MWLTPGRAYGRKHVAPKLFMMAQLEHGHCTARSTVLAAPPAMVKDESGGGQTACRLDPINEGVQTDVLQRGRAGMAHQRSKTQDVRTATWNVSSIVNRSGEVVDVLHRRNNNFCCAQETRWTGESARMLGANGKGYKFFWQGCNNGCYYEWLFTQQSKPSKIFGYYNLS